MSDTRSSTPSSEVPRRRQWVILSLVGVVIAVAVVALALFQPWKLWVDDKVDEAAPVGAVPITTVAEAAAPSATVQPPTTEAAAVVPSTASSIATPALPTVTEPVAPPATVAPSTAPPVPVGGEFVSLDHGTSGVVALLQDASGAQFVRLENLDTSNGPDLFVYLSTNPPDGPEGDFDDDYVNLGRLEGNVGSSNYTVPAGTELFRYASVVIWCDRFDSAFGAAPLS